MRGFTLVELAIVLVLIGLIIGGVLVGRDMIRAAELNSISSDFAKYRAAATTFKDRYRQWPGDMANASSQWPSCVTTANTLCDGNNNGRIEVGSMIGMNMLSEHLTGWVHLGLAGLVSENFTMTTASQVIPGTSAPAGRLSGTAYTFGTDGGGGALGLSFGRPFNDLTHNNEFYGTLVPADAHNIDTKMDNGNANTGKLRGLPPVDAATPDDCADSTTGVYALAATTPTCHLAYHF